MPVNIVSHCILCNDSHPDQPNQLYFSDCSINHTIQHANVNFTGMPITFSSTVPVICDEGYQLQGVSDIECLPGGEWSNNTACIVQSMYG